VVNQRTTPGRRIKNKSALHDIKSGGQTREPRCQRTERGNLDVSNAEASRKLGRKYPAIWVLLIRRRMLCSLRWVIPGLAEGVTGWLAGRG